MTKRKNGEQEAIVILENLGVEIDKSYCDDNSHNSMPDIRCKDGRYIEVTHTHHNNAIPQGRIKFNRLQSGEDGKAYIQRRLKAGQECHLALKRFNKFAYEEDDNGRLTPAGLSQYNKDINLIKKHYGYDLSEKDLKEQHSEFNCDIPSMIFSTDNILREITEDKGKKYPDGNVDLFIFVDEEEFRLMKELISQRSWNGVAIGFLNQILVSSFPKIYVCEWYFEKQEYNIDNPQFVIFEKCEEGLKWECHNLKNDDSDIPKPI